MTKRELNDLFFAALDHSEMRNKDETPRKNENELDLLNFSITRVTNDVHIYSFAKHQRLNKFSKSGLKSTNTGSYQKREEVSNNSVLILEFKHLIILSMYKMFEECLNFTDDSVLQEKFILVHEKIKMTLLVRDRPRASHRSVI